MRIDDGASFATLDAYLSQLEAELAVVTPAERREILLETRSHVLERAGRSPDTTVPEILAELGSPGVYARRFRPEQSNASGHHVVMRALLRLTSGGWKTVPVFALIIGAYFVAALLFLIAVGKLMEPAATGLFVDTVNGRRHVMLYWSSGDVRGRDVLGLWLVPLAIGISLAIHLAMSALLRRVVLHDTPDR